MELELTRSQLVRWRTAVFAIFLASGLIDRDVGVAGPRHQDRARRRQHPDRPDAARRGHRLDHRRCSLAPVVLARFGARRGHARARCSSSRSASRSSASAPTSRTPTSLVVAGLVLFGLGNGAVDVMMNVEGAAIEKQVGKTILPLFHAFFSFGTVIGAGLGALAVAWGLNVLVHTAVMAVVDRRDRLRRRIANVPAREITMDPVDEADRKALARAAAHRDVGLARAAHLRARRHHARHGLRRGRRERLARARHGRGPRRRRRPSARSASTVFSVSMTVVRIFGGPLVDRFGRVATLRVLAALGDRRPAAVHPRPQHPARLRRRGAVGRGRLARLPARHVGRGRRPGQGGRARERRRDDRLHLVPLRTADPRVHQRAASACSTRCTSWSALAVASGSRLGRRQADRRLDRRRRAPAATTLTVRA